MTPEYLVLARAVHFGACLLFFGIYAFDHFVAACLFTGTEKETQLDAASKKQRRISGARVCGPQHVADETKPGNSFHVASVSACGGSQSRASGAVRRHTREIEVANYWRAHLQIFSLILLPVILLSGLAWFVLVTATMSGLSLGQAWQLEPLKMVLTQTQFGTLWEIRFVFWASALFTAIAFNWLRPGVAFRKYLRWLQLILGGCLLGSLAWAGHGRENSTWHLSADIGHLLVAGFWPTGLLPFFLLLRKLRQFAEPMGPNLLRLLVQRFSSVSLISVALLVVTGWVNAWFLAGSFANLIAQVYGRWLLVKIVLFGLVVAIGAVNLLRLKPRLSAENSSTEVIRATAEKLQFNVQIELVIGMAIVVIVAILGILPPANQ